MQGVTTMEVKTGRPNPTLGEVYLVEFAGNGSTQRGLRPAVIFQNNIGNRYSPNVTVLPMTSVVKKLCQDTHVFIPADGTGLRRDSVVLCENPVCIPKDSLGTYLTMLPDKYIGEIAVASLLASSAVAFLSQDEVDGVCKRARELNAPRCA